MQGLPVRQLAFWPRPLFAATACNVPERPKFKFLFQLFTFVGSGTFHGQSLGAICAMLQAKVAEERSVPDESVSRMGDKDLQSALLMVATPLIRELYRRGYVVTVTDRDGNHAIAAEAVRLVVERKTT